MLLVADLQQVFSGVKIFVELLFWSIFLSKYVKLVL